MKSKRNEYIHSKITLSLYVFEWKFVPAEIHKPNLYCLGEYPRSCRNEPTQDYFRSWLVFKSVSVGILVYSSQVRWLNTRCILNSKLHNLRRSYYTYFYIRWTIDYAYNLLTVIITFTNTIVVNSCEEYP